MGYGGPSPNYLRSRHRRKDTDILELWGVPTYLPPIPMMSSTGDHSNGDHPKGDFFQAGRLKSGRLVYPTDCMRHKEE